MIEGYDWCWWWSTYLNSQGTNVIIWSKDRDLTQLVNTDNDGCFTVCWNKDSGITCMDKDEDEFNFLFNNEFSENDKLFQTLSNKSVAVNKINPSEVCIDKIVRGDLGDNIQPIIIKKSKNESSTRIYRVSQKDIDTSLNIFDENNVRVYIDNLCESKSYKNRVNDRTPYEVFEHFLYNRRLVVLNEKSYPEHILSIMQSHTEYNVCRDLSEAEHIIAAQRSELIDILDLV
jgi:5'-3' exonuclease